MKMINAIFPHTEGGIFFALWPIKQRRFMYKEKQKILKSTDFSKVLKRLSYQILEKDPDVDNLVLFGIQRRGVFLAKRIQAIIEEIEGRSLSLGIIDITLYRDDLTVIGPMPLVRETRVDFDINGKVVVLVDDVLFTGRTVRAALDEIMDFGRPKKIQLAVFVDRGHREVPIRADFVGKNIPTSEEEHVVVEVKELDGKDEVVVLEEQDG